MSHESPKPIIVSADEAGRADRVVGLRYPEASRKRLADLFAKGLIRVDGKRVKKGHLVREGQQIRLERTPDQPQDLHPKAQAGDLQIIHEDSEILVIAKAVGMPTHPLRASELDTLANRLVAKYPESIGIGKDPREAGLAHRLDTYTSGLLVVGRTQEAWLNLRASFAAGRVKKSYIAAVHDRPIGVECQEPLLQIGKRVAIDYAGLEAHTSWEMLDRNEEYSVLRCYAHSGRMHQVRAHLAHCNSPIVGDQIYGGVQQEDLLGHFLHAATLSLPHPGTGDMQTWTAPLPADRNRWLVSHGLKAPAP